MTKFQLSLSLGKHKNNTPPLFTCTDKKRNPRKVILYRDLFLEKSFSHFAERAGFEPAIHFWRIHAFQACLFNHSSTSPLETQKLLRKFGGIALHNNKKAAKQLLFSGETGIRTPGTSRYNGFQDRRNRPLCHLSKTSLSEVLLVKSGAKVQRYFKPARVFTKNLI